MVATHPMRLAATAFAPAPRRRVPWIALGLAAAAMSGAALAALPKAPMESLDRQAQWQALAIRPLSVGGGTGYRMEARGSVQPIESAPARAAPFTLTDAAQPPAKPEGPVRIRGRIGDGLYWSLRSAGATPQAAAQYLAALATAVDLGGDAQAGDGFDLVLARPGGALLYAGLDRSTERDVRLVRWSEKGRSEWVDATGTGQPRPTATGMLLPANGHITSYFGNRVHPILRFTRFHAGLDIGASWGSPIVAAGDGQVIGAGWAGGYGRQVRIVHAGGLVSSYSHMSDYAVAPGDLVHRGQVIGYVGSSGLSTGPHLHFEVRRGGVPVNPLAVRIQGVVTADPAYVAAIRARLKALLSVGTKRSA